MKYPQPEMEKARVSQPWLDIREPDMRAHLQGATLLPRTRWTPSAWRLEMAMVILEPPILMDDTTDIYKTCTVFAKKLIQKC